MIRIRRSHERGHANYDWLDTYHTFSFNDYHDPAHMGYRVLRVINEDRVAPGQGFPMHGHRDMEIVTYVLSGELEHRDSLGNGAVLRPGELQRITAGRGIQHSEFNPSPSVPVHLYQIWLLPRERGLAPSYEQREMPPQNRNGELRLVASCDGRQGSLRIEQDAEIFLSSLDANQRMTHALAAGRGAWLQVVRGAVTLGGQRLEQGDAAAIDEVSHIEIDAPERAEVMLFDLP